MVDPKNRSLRPPIQRSWLRLRLGKAYYAGKVDLARAVREVQP